MSWPCPVGFRKAFRLYQAPFNKLAANDPQQTGSGFILNGFYPAVPVDRVVFDNAGGPWLNLDGLPLLVFDRNVPYP